jgi:hypothetical protein
MQVIQLESIAEARAWVSTDFRNMVAHGAALRDKVPPSFHYHMADFVQGARPQWLARAKVILGGRYLAKTWLGARQYCKFRWRRCPWAQVIVHSSNDSMAKRFVAAIKEELNLDPLMADLAPEPSSSDYEFNLRGIKPEQGCSIVAAGIKSSLTGSRADLYIMDDPEPEIDPESMRDRILQAVGEAGDILTNPARHLHLMVNEYGDPLAELPDIERHQLLLLGQPHWLGTAYVPQPEDFEEGADGHPLIDAIYLKIPTVKPDGTWRWPEMMNQKYRHPRKKRPMTVAEVKRSMPTSRWELQHMINTDFARLAGAILQLREVEIRFQQIAHPLMFVDTADSESGCEWGVAIGGLFENKIHVCYLGGFHGEAYDFLDEDEERAPSGESTWRRVFDIAAEFGVHQVMIEKNFKSAMSACRRYIRKHGARCTVLEYHSSRNKKKRIPENLEQPVNNGMVSANPTVFEDRENVRQLSKLRWDKLPRPNDRIDALSDLVGTLIEEPHLYHIGASVDSMTKYNGQTTSSSRAKIVATPFDRIRR